MRSIVKNYTAGFTSGLLSFAAVYFFENSLAIMVAPGIIYGIALFIIYSKNRLTSAPFIILSTISYFVAFWTVLYTIFSLKEFSLILGALIGAFLLLVSFKMNLRNISFISILILCVISALLSLSWYLAPEKVLITREDGFNWENLFILFVIWQSGMSVAISIILKREEK